MLDAERLAQLRLIRSDTVGPAGFRHLVARFGSAARALEALPDLARSAGGSAPRIPSLAEAKQEVARLGALGGRFLFHDDPDFPPLLSETDGAPVLLAVRGDVGLLRRPCLSVVGARNASAAACRFARSLSRELGQAGLVIVSGLARGIDSAAHDGAMETGTIAVIAGGLDIAYPPENEDRQAAIAEQGLLVAEQPIGLEPRARHFPRRNRIIAGLSAATLVVEAAPKSGSLITARQAADFGRDVLAVPGSPLDPRAQGCNQLIRDGATLVQSAADILEALNPFTVSQPAVRPSPTLVQVEPAGTRTDGLFELLGPTPVPVDELVRQSGISPSAVQTILLDLELSGRLERHAGGKVSRRT